MSSYGKVIEMETLTVGDIMEVLRTLPSDAEVLPTGEHFMFAKGDDGSVYFDNDDWIRKNFRSTYCTCKKCGHKDYKVQFIGAVCPKCNSMDITKEEEKDG